MGVHHMGKFSASILALSLALLAGGAAAEGKAASKKGAKEIRACMARNLVSRGALRDLALEKFDKEGKVGDLRMRLYWKPSKTGGTRVHLKIVDPPAMAGSIYLLLQEGYNEEIYFALPGVDHGLRITGQNTSESLWGTDFSYGEIKEVLGLLVTGTTTKGADAKIADRAVWTLETDVAAAGAYNKVISSVDQKSCTLLKSEFVGKSGKTRKVLEADVSTLLQADKYWTVLGYTMSDLEKGTHTTLNLTDLSFDESMAEKMFDPRRFAEPPGSR